MSASGLPAAISKLVSEKRAIGRPDLAHKIFRTAFMLAAVMGMVCMVAIILFARPITAAMGDSQVYLALLTLSPTVFIVSMMAVIRGYFQGMQSSVPTAISQIVEQIFNAIFSVVLAHALWNFAMSNYPDERFIYGAAGGTSGTGIGALAGFMFIAAFYFLVRGDILRDVRRSRRANRKADDSEYSIAKIAKKIIATSFPIIAGTAVFSIVALIDATIVVNRLQMAGFDETRARQLFGQIVGKFNPITNIPAAISSSLAIAVLPVIAEFHELKRYRDVNSKINTAFRTAMIMTTPIAFGLGILGPQIVAMLFRSHPEGGTLFVIGFSSIVFLAVTHVATGALQAIGKIYVPVVAAICGAVAKIAINLILIPIPAINVYGAIIGTTVCYLITSIINCIVLARQTKSRFDIMGIFIKPAAASALMALGCYVVYNTIYYIIPRNAISTLISILFGMVLYLAFMLLFKGIREEEVLMLPSGKKLAALLKRFRLI